MKDFQNPESICEIKKSNFNQFNNEFEEKLNSQIDTKANENWTNLTFYLLAFTLF